MPSPSDNNKKKVKKITKKKIDENIIIKENKNIEEKKDKLNINNNIYNKKEDDKNIQNQKKEYIDESKTKDNIILYREIEDSNKEKSKEVEKTIEKEKMNLSEQMKLSEIRNNVSPGNDSHSFINSSFPLLSKKEEEEEINNYFYNDQINYNYKSNTIKKEKGKSNKIIFTYGNSNAKSAKSAKKMYRTRENCSPIDYNILQDQSELNFICKRIHGNKYKVIFNLLYKATEDKDKSSIFHRKCDKAQTTLVLIETKNGLRFGGYTKRTWKGISTEKVDNEAFIFSLNKYEIYNVIRGKKAIGCYEELGPIFLGGFQINDNAFVKGGNTFYAGGSYEINQDFELTNGDKNFDIKEIEVYEIKIA